MVFNQRYKDNPRTGVAGDPWRATDAEASHGVQGKLGSRPSSAIHLGFHLYLCIV